MKKYILDYKNAKQVNGVWDIPRIETDGRCDYYVIENIAYQDCPFCGFRNNYDDWVCGSCGAQ